MEHYIKIFEPYYEEEKAMLYLADSFEAMKKMQRESVDMIFADPPYFLSNNGISVQSGKRVSVNKGDWDKAKNLTEMHKFNRKWIRWSKKILKPNGTIWISGTFHNIYSVGMALVQEGFKILNNITWQKNNPPPNISCRYFTHSTETILWARKDNYKAKHFFNYKLMKEMNGGKQMKDVWKDNQPKIFSEEDLKTTDTAISNATVSAEDNLIDVWRGSLTGQREKKYGKHPTQKPIYLLQKIILASTQENDLVFDPFCGSATTGVACKLLNRNFIGIDNEEKFLELSRERLIHADDYKNI